MKGATFHDVVAALVSLALLGGILALVWSSREVPEALWVAFSAAMGYVFRGGLNGTGRLVNHLRPPPGASTTERGL